MEQSPISSPLVYLNLASNNGKVQIQEDPLVSELNLLHCADDPRLLKVLGIISGSNRPLVPRQLTRLGQLLVVWLNDNEWIVLPAPQFGHDLEQALYSTFADEIALELIPDGTFQLLLSEGARQQIIDSESQTILASGNQTTFTPGYSICVRPWAKLSNYDLLLSQQDLQLLQRWLNNLQH